MEARINKTLLNKITISKFEQVLIDCNLDSDFWNILIQKKVFFEENQKMYLYYCQDVHIGTYLIKNKSGWILKPNVQL